MKILSVAFRFRYFPKTWKEANVISIPKPNKNPTFPQDRWSISLLDTVGKVMEKTPYKQIHPTLLCHIPDNNLPYY
jgi:hypothetical protein